MKYLVGETEAGTAVFAINGDAAVNLTALDARVGNDLMGLINTPDLAASMSDAIAGAPSVPVASIVPALPVANPGTIICLGLNYIDHIKEGGYEVPEYPALFMRSKKSIMAAGAPMVRPTVSEKLDYEVELMVIVGKGGRHIAEEDALDHVFAYTVLNDGSVRDYQRKTHQWTPGKNFDNTGAIGPISVTPDELPVGAVGLKIESRVGDEILQSANTDDMMWSVAKTIALISVYTTLEPGDYIAMGTPPGVGHAKTPPRWLRPGETVDVEVEGIGICSSPIVDEKDFDAKVAAQ
ncbi:fumarylacetoacetate hydrolase family protein [Pelagimonas varians]|uniref:Ureidoglycolate lyase n=1 Tax=Pelagimonas varians TaxID=696760 RepID=A0A238JYD5_9RHOB|nr:fumarylacetoacetate hydrolase family protein [Pelagimonas varians]PYG33038.1 2-keto-4-pentenoate hydratase/2-oxohepta-3-ene-1,7-dioic acid hydratase in catechol pathway [Pelagimonas varians]SMX35513.1 Ureidoglycolate lyase [Pelagimonas varians]